MIDRGLADPGLLASYPRTDYRQLGLELRPVESGAGASSRSSFTSSIPPTVSPSLAAGPYIDTTGFWSSYVSRVRSPSWMTSVEESTVAGGGQQRTFFFLGLLRTCVRSD